MSELIELSEGFGIDFSRKYNDYIEKINGPLADNLNFFAVAGYDICDFNSILKSYNIMIESIIPTEDYLKNSSKPKIINALDISNHIPVNTKIVGVGTTSLVKTIYKELGLIPKKYLVRK